MSAGPEPLVVRVLHLIGSLKVGGAETVVTALLRSSDHDRFQYTILILDRGPLMDELSCAPVRVMIQPFRWLTMPLWLLKTVRCLRALRIDVVHTHLFGTDMLGRVAGRLARVPVIVSTYHAPSTWKQKRSGKYLLRKTLDALTANCLTDGLTAISDAVSTYQATTGQIRRDKLRVITNPVRCHRFRSDADLRAAMRGELGVFEEERIVINVSSLAPIKGQAYLLRACPLLLDHPVRWRLLLVGDGPLRSELERGAQSLGITDRVFFLGQRRDVSDLLRASDVFVMSSLSEGVSMAILEAMAAALPIVATRVGGNVDLIEPGHTGMLVEPRDESALAGAIRHLLDAPQEAALLGCNARRHVRQHHDARLIARQYEDYYRELLQRKQRARR